MAFPPAAEGVRSASSFVYDKAYVDGKWVSAKSGATFQGEFKVVIEVLYLSVIEIPVSDVLMILKNTLTV